MDVVCDRCKTEYEFDDALVSERGTTVKCTNCSHQFKIYRNGPPGDAAKTWSLRRPDGTTIPFDSLSVLQKWILEGRVNRFDELSRAGEPWKPLGAIAELESFFVNADTSGAGPLPSPASESIPSPLTRAPNAVVAPASAGSTTGRQGTPFYGSGGRPQPTPGVPAPGLNTPRPLAPRPPALPNATGTLRPAAVPPPVPQSAQKVPSVRPPPVPNHIPPPPRAPSDLGPPTPPPRAPMPPVEAISPPETPRPRQPDPSPRPRSATPASTAMVAPPALRQNTPAPLPEVVAPVFQSRRPPVLDEPADEEPVAPPSRMRGILMGAGLGLLVLGLGVAGAWQLGFLGPRVTTPIVPTVAAPAPVGPMLDRAHALMLRGDRHSLEEARDELTRALGIAPDNRIAQATRAEVMASWSELLRQRAADTEARAAMPGADAPALRAEAALMRREADERAERARADEQTVVAALDQVAPADRPRVEALLGDVARVLNDRTAARQHLDAARSAPDADFFAALLDRDEGNAAHAVSALQSVVTRSGENARARIALARLAMTQNDANTARMQLDAVGRTYAGHEDATALADALTRNEPPMQRDGQTVALNTPPVAPTVAPTALPTPPVAPTVVPTPTPPVAPSNNTAPGNPPSANGAPSGNYDALVAEGDRLQNDGRTQQARERFQRALALRPSGAEALTGMGYSDLDMHNYSSAISRFRQALSSNGHYSEALIGMGEAYSSRGDYPQALRSYNQYLEVNPNGSHASMARRQIESLQDRIQSDGPPGPTRTTPAPGAPNGAETPSDNPSNTPPGA